MRPKNKGVFFFGTIVFFFSEPVFFAIIDLGKTSTVFFGEGLVIRFREVRFFLLGGIFRSWQNDP